MKLNLNNFDKIIFDLDGVITSELAYWYSAACGAYDMLFNYEQYGKCGIDEERCRKDYREIYNVIMCGGKTVRAVKRLAVNTNYDLLYVVFCVSKYLNPDLDTLDEAHFDSVRMFIENIDMKAPELYDSLSALLSTSMPEYEDGHFKHSGDFFEKEVIGTFQKWYLGTDEFEGLITSDELLFDPESIEKMLKELKEKGIRLGIGTGRPDIEMLRPLEKFNILKYFDKNMICTLDDVFAAEQEFNPAQPLSKPDPFVFLKAALGEKHSTKEILDGDYTYAELTKTLIVGDAPSDLFSAQRGGFEFLAVLTGVEGDGMRQYFIDNKADYILDNVLMIADC